MYKQGIAIGGCFIAVLLIWVLPQGLLSHFWNIKLGALFQVMLMAGVFGACKSIWAEVVTKGSSKKGSEIKIFVVRENQHFGPYTTTQAKEMIANNSLHPSDWAYVHGDEECQSLDSVLKK